MESLGKGKTNRVSFYPQRLPASLPGCSMDEADSAVGTYRSTLKKDSVGNEHLMMHFNVGNTARL